MPSPFPGMDPYLEGSTWMNFLGQLCAEIARQLGPKLRPRYLARLTERFFTDISIDPDISKKPIYSDIGVVELGISSSGAESSGHLIELSATTTWSSTTPSPPMCPFRPKKPIAGVSPVKCI